MKMDKVKKKIINYFRKKKEVSLVYMFGSMANKETTPESDIDLAVLFANEKINLFSLQGKYMEELTSIFNRKVDIVNLNASDVFFAYRVVSEGTIIYERNKKARFRLVIDLIKRYFDLKPSYDLFYQSLSERARKGMIG